MKVSANSKLPPQDAQDMKAEVSNTKKAVSFLGDETNPHSSIKQIIEGATENTAMWSIDYDRADFLDKHTQQGHKKLPEKPLQPTDEKISEKSKAAFESAQQLATAFSRSSVAKEPGCCQKITIFAKWLLFGEQRPIIKLLGKRYFIDKNGADIAD